MNSYGSDWGLAAGAWNHHDRLSDGGCCRSKNRRDRNCDNRPKITCSGENLGLGNVHRLLKQRTGWLRD